MSTKELRTLERGNIYTKRQKGPLCAAGAMLLCIVVMISLIVDVVGLPLIKPFLGQSNRLLIRMAIGLRSPVTTADDILVMFL